MARDGMTTFSDIAGKLEMLRVECEKCGRKGQYRVMRLMKELGPEASKVRISLRPRIHRLQIHRRVPRHQQDLR